MTDSITDQHVWEDYGPRIATYQGTGLASLSNGSSVDCQFDAAQMADGANALICDFPASLSDALRVALGFQALKITGFEGTTSDGDRIIVNHIQHAVRTHPNTEKAVLVELRASELHLELSSASPASMRFFITNLQFVGIPDETRLPLTLGNDRLVLARVDQYERVLRQLSRQRTTRVTAEAAIDLNSTVDKAVEVVDAVCYILSVARGTKVQWINYTVLDANGKPILRKHYDRVTKPFCPLPLIDHRASAGTATQTFVESVYPVYLLKRDPYGLNKATLDSYLDAKSEGDFLELRAVKLAVVVELIKTVFRKAEGLPKRPFKKMVEEVCRGIGCTVTSTELDLFIESRNRLVHEGDFLCRNRTGAFNDETEEYFFLLNFLDRVILKILRYSGSCLDCRVAHFGKPMQV